MITRLGHKDDVIAQQAARLISKASKRPVCAVVGIHLDNITKEEINKIMENARIAIDKYITTGLPGLLCRQTK